MATWFTIAREESIGSSVLVEFFLDESMAKVISVTDRDGRRFEQARGRVNILSVDQSMLYPDLVAEAELFDTPGDAWERSQNSGWHGAVTFWDNGNYKTKQMWKDGKPSCTWYEWFEDGMLAHVQDFVNGMRQGPNRWWDNNFNLRLEESYDQDQLHGSRKVFDGIYRVEEQWEKGCLHGCCYWFEAGKVRKREEYDRGKFVQYTVWP
jgi:hypothetical protein